MSRRLTLFVAAAILVAAAAYVFLRPGPDTLVLTGIVTTHDVIVSPQIGGRVAHLLVREGDTVEAGQLVAELAPDELKADSAFAGYSAAGAEAAVHQGEAALRYEEQQLADAVHQAEAELAAAEADRAEAAASLKGATITLGRTEDLSKEGVISAQALDEARTAHDTTEARLAAVTRQVEVKRAALALARSSREQVALKRSALRGTEHQLAAAGAERAKADIRLGYAEVHAPIAGLVDVRAAREGEVIATGQPIVTLINPDDLWVRVDVEETYIDRIRPGDTLTVRLPSGEERQGTVFYRRADAAFATQRDVSRTKRDIRTFEIRLRVDNADRRLAVGMTAYVTLPLGTS